MKLTYSILALAVAGFLGQSAFADSPVQAGLAVTSDGHGGSHFMYYQAFTVDNTSVALYTDQGGVGVTTYLGRNGIQPDNGDTRFVIGTNQHGQSNAAYIPVSSHFAQANQ